MERKFINPYWEDGESKNRIRCQVQITGEDGTKKIFPAVISEGSDDWDYLVENFKEEMDKIWENYLSHRDAKRAAKVEQKQEEKARNKERVKQEALFAKKLEIFEIEAIKNSKNRKIKSLIRKSKSETEALLYASVLINRDLDLEE